PKTYSRKATVLIRDDKKGGGMGESALFADLNLFGGARSVDNELLVFQSRSIMENVVRRLSLNMSYKVRIGLRTIELYTQSPIKVAFLDAEDNQYIHVCVTPLSEKKVRLSELLMIVNNEEIQSVDE
ncbi:UNVERIFIED_CONTAM: chromosome partitioning protein ParA, partial [Bacteroidetes bacterium 56_B9]